MDDQDTGDLRVWRLKYESAVHFIDTGNIREARRILSQLSRKAPYEQIRRDSASRLEQFRPDWVAYAFFGGTLLVLLVLAIKYVF